MISWSDHDSWFSAKLRDQKSNFFYIVATASEQIAFVRFEKKEVWVSSLVLDPSFRGMGLASSCLSLAIKEFEQTENTDLYAWIKKENIGSMKVFKKNSFKVIEEGNVVKLKRGKL